MDAVGSQQPPDFEALYAASDDPWGCRTRWYERRKRNIVLACLPQDRFDRVFEPGCGNGELTADLAQRCNILLASDASANAVGLARARLAESPHVAIEQGSLPVDWPRGYFDLVVVSELGYYLDGKQLAEVAFGISERLRSRGVMLACHWRRALADGTFTGDEVHARLAQSSGLSEIARYWDEDFVLTVWGNASQCVAERGT